MLEYTLTCIDGYAEASLTVFDSYIKNLELVDSNTANLARIPP